MENKYLIRSTDNPMAVLNTDNQGLLNYKKSKENIKNMKSDINFLKEQVTLLTRKISNGS